ncbi:MAG: hypothetical protein M3O71_01740 [Bacteroidota bacterium]|nr:hypothetical protein [Bacteroidota bacterium]
MKTNFLKYSVLIIATAITTAATAQKKPATHKAHTFSGYSNMYSEDGSHETIKTNENGTEYELTLENGKAVELYVNGTKIDESKFGDYKGVIDHLKEQMRLAKIQAKKDQAQALLDQAQAKRDQEQAVKDQAQAKRDQEQATRDQEQAKRDQEQAGRDQLQAKKDDEEARKAEAEAKLDQQQAARDQVQAKRDQEQAMKDQAQAKLDQKQAEEDQRVMKLITADLIKDGLVADEQSLHSLTISPNGMTVNDKQVPDEVYKRYKIKYSRFANSAFSFENSNNSHSIRISKPSH